MTTTEPKHEVRAEFDVRDVVQEDRVHGSVYTSPEIFQREMDTIFSTGWVYVAHDSEVSEPGDYLTRQIGSNPVVVAHGKDGEVRVLLNRCSHRANKLCNAEMGNASSFRCPYHGWTFSNTGSLTAVPMREGYGDAFQGVRSELGLAEAARVDSYGGFIFASLAAEGPSLTEHLGGAVRAIDRLLDLSPTGTIDLRANWMKHRHLANWKMVVENNVDGYHALFTHASVYDAVRPAKVSHVPSKTAVVVRDIGDGHSEIDYAAEYRRIDEEFVWYGRTTREKLPKYSAALEKRHGPEKTHDALVVGPPHTLIWPNLFLAEMNVMYVEPLSVNETIAYTTAAMFPGQDEINQKSLRRAEGAMGPAGFLIADDGEIGMRNQAGLAARDPEWLRLSRGVETDVADETGIVNSDKSAETPQRGFYRQWAKVVGGADAPAATTIEQENDQ
ncbi:aromatic ring-hydroxylating oxygenase subunit alpha [Gordonia humi]|uniref:Phenylpropionate dioxygenase-like ring-hydroxylating dioxygenase large terminal subunit n=1 Tax=Gordonia humi TaxID=686429 RepID=A0A840EXY3_9ACTN|nr:aromatic ring-hydroxylating dioxygenase subunit alpha [Gordonia humi]MBB4135184.1 phenylpropionate dioxygenase-like ring-hydroxylating dioxygenase large terminal subunit [Gordonia humi]